MQLSYPNWNSHYNSTDARLGSMHLGKGAIKSETVKALAKNNAVFAIIPPVTALLGSQTSEIECVCCPELGMEALHRIKVNHYQAIIAAAKGESIYG